MTSADELANDATAHAERLQRVVEAGVALHAELSLDDLLRRVVESVADLTGARYVALGVIDQRGVELERFITHGIDEETRHRIGELPRGRGILGALIRDARPLRLDDLHDDPRSVGFPPGHPSMASFLGVPIFLRGVAYGNLYLTEKADGAGFTEEDVHIVSLLAAQAAVAVENTRLYESSVRWSRQLESLAEIGKSLADEIEPRALLQLVVERVRDLVGARFVYVALARPDGSLEIDASAGEHAEEAIGRRLDPRRSKSGEVMHRHRGERIDSMLDDPEVDRGLARDWGVRAAIFVPLLVRGEPIGVVSVNDRAGPDPRFSETDYRLVQEVADRAAVAIDLSRRVEMETVARILETQELERKRMARELHDETGQALTAILLGLKPLEAEAGETVGALRELVKSALASVRRLSVELRPAVLDDFGLAAALERSCDDLRERTDVEVALDVRGLQERLPADVETTLYRVAQEALANAVRHASPRAIRIELEHTAATVTLALSDDGSGFAPEAVPSDRLGLVGMRERLALLGGTLRIDSAPGRGTRITAEAPVAPE